VCGVCEYGNRACGNTCGLCCVLAALLGDDRNTPQGFEDLRVAPQGDWPGRRAVFAGEPLQQSLLAVLLAQDVGLRTPRQNFQLWLGCD
jgi:hypothetical protein